MRRNYEEKLSVEIMTRNYELVYYVAQNGIIGILAYPKIIKDFLVMTPNNSFLFFILKQFGLQ